MCTGPYTLFSACMDWIIGRMSVRSSCGASFGNAKISDLDFSDDVVIFAETLGILVGALEVLGFEECHSSVGATGIKCFLGQNEDPSFQ